jgi:hypothetical protein
MSLLPELFWRLRGGRDRHPQVALRGFATASSGSGSSRLDAARWPARAPVVVPACRWPRSRRRTQCATRRSVSHSVAPRSLCPRRRSDLRPSTRQSVSPVGSTPLQTGTLSPIRPGPVDRSRSGHGSAPPDSVPGRRSRGRRGLLSVPPTRRAAAGGPGRPAARVPGAGLAPRGGTR